jgi:hypothetical protein
VYCTTDSQALTISFERKLRGPKPELDPASQGSESALVPDRQGASFQKSFPVPQSPKCSKGKKSHERWSDGEHPSQQVCATVDVRIFY